MPNYHATSEGNVPFTEEEEMQWAAEQAAWTAGARGRTAAKVRTERNAKIAACDWRMLNDMSVSELWKAYRQALRDVPQQAGFPENVVWPVTP